MKTLVLFIAGLWFAHAAYGQSSGRIEGMLTDTSGNGLWGVRIDILNSAGATGGRGAHSRPGGSYNVINLRPGRYDLQYSCAGYIILIVHGILVTTDADTEVDLHLHPSEELTYEVIQYEDPPFKGLPYFFKR